MIFKLGIYFPGTISEQVSSGKSKYISTIPIRRNDCIATVTKREVQNRAREGLDILNFVAASEEAEGV